MSILVVDDNTLLLGRIVHSLIKLDHTVHTATTLHQARSILYQELPQVLCLDVNLPDGNGLDLLEEIRNTGHCPPVVIVCGHDSLENRLRTSQLRAAGFLAKPFVVSDLHELLNDQLANSIANEGRARESMDASSASVNNSIVVAPIAASRT